jgi:hypothetical protein
MEGRKISGEGSLQSKPESQKKDLSDVGKNTDNSKRPRKSIDVKTNSRKELSVGEKSQKLNEAASSIDELFDNAVKKKRLDKELAKKQQKLLEDEKARVREAAVEQKTLMSGNPDPRVHRFDQESGLPVYKYYDLRMGEPGSGFTPLCPFDCHCCF